MTDADYLGQVAGMFDSSQAKQKIDLSTLSDAQIFHLEQALDCMYDASLHLIEFTDEFAEEATELANAAETELEKRRLLPDTMRNFYRS